MGNIVVKGAKKNAVVFISKIKSVYHQVLERIKGRVTWAEKTRGKELGRKVSVFQNCLMPQSSIYF